MVRQLLVKKEPGGMVLILDKWSREGSRTAYRITATLHGVEGIAWLYRDTNRQRAEGVYSYLTQNWSLAVLHAREVLEDS
jgi:hypothetical protein